MRHGFNLSAYVERGWIGKYRFLYLGNLNESSSAQQAFETLSDGVRWLGSESIASPDLSLKAFQGIVELTL
jgi:hypothetical protein